MAINPIGVGGRILASLINQIIAAVNGTALVGIVPTSVVGSGVTVSPNGQVTFINAPVVSLNGVFTGTYDNYRITWNSNNRSSTSSTQFRLRAAGTDVATNYDYVKGVDSGTGRTVTSSSSSTAAPLDQGIAVGQQTNGVIDIFYPAAAKTTTATVDSSVLAASAVTACTVSIAQEDSTVFDGFSMYPLTGGATWSGILRVYGYNNLI